MEQEIIKGIFSSFGLSVFLVASGPLFGLILMFLAFRVGKHYLASQLEIQRQQAETLRRMAEIMAELRRDTEEIKEITRDNNVKLHVLEEKIVEKRRRPPRAS